jgi:putative phosphoribosyl transferase
MLFRDRQHAGRILADLLGRYAHQPDVTVLALPRGGVPVAFEVARALAAPLDVFIVRKLGVPGYEELAMGAIASGDTIVLNDELVRDLRIPGDMIEAAVEREKRELDRREREYRDGLPPPAVAGCITILVDDGLATGASMRAAAIALRARKPARIVVAVPVAAPSTCEEFQTVVDEIICSQSPEPFYGVGYWYEDFGQTTDAEVRDLLRRSRQQEAIPAPAAG